MLLRRYSHPGSCLLAIVEADQHTVWAIAIDDSKTEVTGFHTKISKEKHLQGTCNYRV